MVEIDIKTAELLLKSIYRTPMDIEDKTENGVMRFALAVAALQTALSKATQ